jgi:enamine deaminase RidA (YjgF/YER057c/UK114 family)
MPKRYLVSLPSVEGKIEDEWNQCLYQIVKSRSSGYIPVKLNVFVDFPDFESSLEIRKSMLQLLFNEFGSATPAINISALPPQKPWKVVVEGTFITGNAATFTAKNYQSVQYVVLESGDRKEIWAAGASSYMFPDDTRRAAEDAFEIMADLLASENMSLDNLVRQWNYIGNILDVKNGMQNYQAFNEVRNDYYTKYRKIAGYPAATGVGMKHGGVILDFCAVQPGKSMQIKAVDNPNQVNAYNYGQQVLIGKTKAGDPVKHPPQFERALLMADGNDVVLHISGTASIIGQKTMGKGDVGEQTIVTLENIKKLIDTERLNQIIPGAFPYHGKYSLFRVYIKRQEDFGIVRKICSEHFPSLPITYIEADICRDDLLMEIEAEAEPGQ